MLRRLAGLILICVFVLSASASLSAADRPNILWITAEDLSPDKIGCYGSSYAKTPVIDALATEGVRYLHAYAPAPVCTPARSSTITGVYASSLGTQHLRGTQPLPASIRCFSEYLRDAGYYCTNNVKEDYNFKTPSTAWDESSSKAHWRGRKLGQPFFAIFNFVTTHQSRVRYDEKKFAEITSRLTDAQRHDPADAPLPPYYPDTPAVRRDVARYYDMATAMDYQVGDILAQLEEDGLRENTIIFFYSDHGDGLPRHKRWLYDSGLRVPFVLWVPEKYKCLLPAPRGKTTDRLITFVDLAPTMLSLIGLDVPDYMQGHAFLGSKKTPAPQYAFGIRDRVDEVFETSRTVTNGKFRYIRNFMPHRPSLQYSTFSEITPIRKELRRLHAEGKLTGPAADFMKPTKPIEELYDVEADPHMVNNLAGSPEHKEIRSKLHDALCDWMQASRDTGIFPEAEMQRLAGEGSPYDSIEKIDSYFGLFSAFVIMGGVGEDVGLGDVDKFYLLQSAQCEEPTRQYWAVLMLMLRTERTKEITTAFHKALQSKSPVVRCAAAEAILRDGPNDEAIKTLGKLLDSEEPRVVLQTAATLVALGDRVKPLFPKMREIRDMNKGGGHYPLYIRWALQYALEKVNPMESGYGF